MKILKTGEKKQNAHPKFHPWCYVVSNRLVAIVKSVTIFKMLEFFSSLRFPLSQRRMSVLRFNGSIEMSMPVISETFRNMVALDNLKEVHVRRKWFVSSGTWHIMQFGVTPMNLCFALCAWRGLNSMRNIVIWRILLWSKLWSIRPYHGFLAGLIIFKSVSFECIYIAFLAASADVSRVSLL